jgi:hypothetical protein
MQASPAFARYAVFIGIASKQVSVTVIGAEKWVVEANVASKPPSGAKPRNHTSLSFLNQVGEG